MLDELYTYVTCKLPIDTGMQATGLPPDILHTVQMAESRTAIDAIPSRVEAILEERSILANSITPAYIRQILEEHHNQLRIMYAPSTEANAAETISKSRHIFNWDGGLHLLPSNYEFPKVGLRTIFQHWFIGSNSEPPLRRIKPIDLPKNQRKRLSDLKWIMQKMETNIKGQNRWTDNPTLLQVNDMFDIGFAGLGLIDTTLTNRTRRLGEMKWNTVVKVLRKQ
jgi:hypothetical protein